MNTATKTQAELNDNIRYLAVHMILGNIRAQHIAKKSNVSNAIVAKVLKNKLLFKDKSRFGIKLIVKKMWKIYLFFNKK